VHNSILRRWLRNPSLDLRPELEEAFADLRRAAVLGTAASSLSADGVPLTRRVVVAVVEGLAGPDEVARAVRDALV
jgi:hypothetical protein